RKLKARNPRLKIGVGGCVGSQERERLLKDQPLIDFVFGTDNIDELPDLVEDVLSTGQRQSRAQFHHKEPYLMETLVRNPGVASFVNITKGCDNFCTFCIVPYTRGREKSRPVEDIVGDVRRLVQRGVREVTLLGQNVNSYESEKGVHFAGLLKIVAEETLIERIRFTTSHPKDFDEELVGVMRDYREKICEYIHLPFQSGSTRILEMMNRGYTRDEYLQRIARLRSVFPEVVFSTDIIVGFPSETEEDFQDTIRMVQEVGFETIFAFKYSPRPMTKAAHFEGQIPEEVKSERLERLFRAHEDQALPKVARYEGQVLDVLIERKDARTGLLSGRSRQNKLVHFQGSEEWVGQTRPVRILKAFPSVLRGEYLKI
ncbi:MAG: tRNA (N6-isopentenyl adenosine(37)-C2)-methylthiotransferase MiaB, partial [Bdellovibrio sp.]